MAKGKSNKKNTKGAVTRIKVIPKLQLTEDRSVGLTPNKAVGPAAVVKIITTDGLQRTLVIHHPIGFNDLNETDWVVTPPNGVADLLRHEEHPDAPRIEQTRRDVMTSWLVKTSLLQEKPQGDGTISLVYPGTDIVRAEAMRQARVDKALDQKESGGSAPLLMYLPEHVQEMESQLGLYKARNQANLENAVPLPHYETCSGPSSDTKQFRSPLRGSKPGNLMDSICKWLTTADPVGVGGSIEPAAPEWVNNPGRDSDVVETEEVTYTAPAPNIGTEGTEDATLTSKASYAQRVKKKLRPKKSPDPPKEESHDNTAGASL